MSLRLFALQVLSLQSCLAFGMYNHYNLPLETLEASANAYCAAHGIQVESRTDEGVQYRSAPISLLPNAYPKAAFEQAVAIAPLFNKLVDVLSRDASFLQDTLGGSVAAADPYTAKLLTLYNKLYADNSNNNNEAAQSADRLGILRSDYMLHQTKNNGQTYAIKQVELNTIAASFAGLASQVANLHRYLLSRNQENQPLQDFLSHNQQAVVNHADAAADGVPNNPSLKCLPLAFDVAVQHYKKRHNISKQAVCVLFVVQEGETNTVDQRMLEFQLFQNHGIPVIRKSLAQIHAQITTTECGALLLDDMEIAVVYFRAGYAPTDYPGGNDGVEWQAREILEASRATKCPNLGYHLAGTKKVQQELARPGVLERFVSSDEASKLRAAFAGLYSLGDDATPEDIDAVRNVLGGQQGQYVLKPQREGGGYNFYGDKLYAKLKENVSVDYRLDPKLGEYILMERLFPPQQKAILLRNGKVEGSGDSVSELGCFGALVVDAKGDILHNEYSGFLLRTKFSNVDEGGVASGFATLSSPYLC